MSFDKTALYRHYNAEGDLLYVGISNDPTRRFEDHIKDKPWVYHVSRVTVEWYRNRYIAAMYETAAIRWEHPLHNKQGVVKDSENFKYFLGLRNPEQPDEYHASLALLIAENVQLCKDSNLPICEQASFEFATYEALIELAVEIEDRLLTKCDKCNKLLNVSWLSDGQEVVVDIHQDLYLRKGKD